MPAKYIPSNSLVKKVRALSKKRQISRNKAASILGISDWNLKTLSSKYNIKWETYVYDQTGLKKGMVTIIAKSDRRYGTAHMVWKCRCDCGNICYLPIKHLKSRIPNCGCYFRSQTGIATLRAIFFDYKAGSKKRKILFKLSYDYFLKIIKSPCFYCGLEPQPFIHGYRRKKYPTKYQGLKNGIDRVDNNKGYTERNVVPCCKMCNFAKGTLVFHEFQYWLQRAHNHLLKSKWDFDFSC